MTTLPGLQGLTDADVNEREASGQRNLTPPRGGRTVADIVRANVFTRINALLGVLFVIVVSTGSWINAAFGLLIVVNSAVGIVQEVRAKRTLDALAVVGEAKPIVRRATATGPLPADRIVRDDIIEIGPGDQIVVDGEIVEASALEVDESLLTGESDPEPKELGDGVMSGSFVVSGTGAYRATKVGGEAYAARLAAEASKFSVTNSALQSGINDILKVITWLLVPVGLATVVTQWRVVEGDWRQAVLRMAGAIVPMVPEGLVLLTSVAFALGVIRLGRRQCLVQELPAIEGLARVDVVCADKTGTLTQAGMRLSEVEPLPGFDRSQVDAALARLVAADPRPNASLSAIKDALPAGEQPPQPEGVVPFSSARKWSGAWYRDDAWVLGAPEVVDAAGRVPQAAQRAAGGDRVLLLARAAGPLSDQLPQVEPAALLVLEQKVRPDAADTLTYFADQGVEVKVISGDNAASVGAVTRALGMDAGEPVDARQLTAESLPTAAATSRIFGRVTPQQKRQLVGALQSEGRTVAMTGDGVNDVLALKDADLGVAMGSGSAAARSVAQIVLLDDRFATLPHVVAEGRRVIGNIERVANLFLTKTVYSALLALAVIVSGLPFPFLPIHVTITGWFTIGVPAFILSLAPNHERARDGFVRRVLRLGVPAGAVVASVAFLTYLLAQGRGTSTQASTAALAALIVAASWVLAVVARPYRPWKIALVAASLLLYAVMFVWPLTQQLFALDSSNHALMALGLGIGAAGAALIEALWWIVRRTAGEPARLWDTSSIEVPELES